MAICVVSFCLLAGCGVTEPSNDFGKPADAEIQADQSSDMKIALDFQEYLGRPCVVAGGTFEVPPKFRDDPRVMRLYRGYEALCLSIGTVEVEDERITLKSGLENDIEGQEAGTAFCDVVQNSDVADFTQGHELQERNGDTIKVCKARTP